MTLAHPATKISFRVISHGGAAQSFILDNASLILGTATAPGTPPATEPAPAPGSTDPLNLLQNASFETVSSGAPASWTKVGAGSLTQAAAGQTGAAAKIDASTWGH